MRHRGPDGEGIWHRKEGLIGFGHKRLAIIDPCGGIQPFTDAGGNITIVFNGCIYNYIELREELISLGYKFVTTSDTEVVANAYAAYGTDCLKRFVGMFAFALWDEKRRQLFCARDRIGIKPFYYECRREGFFFASEIKALLAMRSGSASLCCEALQEYLTFQVYIGENTLFEGVRRLMPGHFMTVGPDGKITRCEKYWDLEFEENGEGRAEEDYVGELRKLLSDAVRLRLRSDVKLGAHLSGGLDSSTVVCLARSLYGETSPLSVFTGAFDDGEEYDESVYSRIVASETGSSLFEVRPTPRDFTDSMEKIIWLMDEPEAGPGVFPQYMVSKLASEHVKVVLGGQGGDEIFAGYARYLVGYLEECLLGAIEGNPDSQKNLCGLSENLSTLKQYKPMLRSFWKEGLFERQDMRYFHLMDRSAGLENIYNRELFEGVDSLKNRFSLIFNGSNAGSFLNRMLYFDLKVHLPALLHVEDRTSMGWGLESRVPLLDHRIVEYAARIPVAVKFSKGRTKHIFRSSVKGIIPSAVLNRKDKKGFPVPLHSWQKGPLKEYIGDILLSERARTRGIFNIPELEKAVMDEGSFGRIVWGALCLELWFRKFMDK